jgi:hypothetical protein
VFLQDVKALRQFLKLPPKTDSRLALDSWLDSLADMDTKRKAPKPAEVNLQQTWDPLADGLDQSDPQFQTRSVI